MNETSMHSDGEQWESAVFAGFDNYSCFTFFVSLANPVVNFKPISTTRSWVVLRHQYGISAQPRSQGFFSSSREAKYNPNNEVDCSRTVHVLQM